jgi:hypothetical protein
MKKLSLIGCLALLVACLPPSGIEQGTPTLALDPMPTATVRTPTVIASVTPAFTSAPIPSPTSIPLFFTEEFDSTLESWTSFLTSGESTPRVDLRSGSLDIVFSSPNTWYYALHNAHEYERIHVDAKFDSSGNQPATIGVICNYDEEDGWFEFNLSTDGTYSVLYGQLIATDIAQYRPIVNETSEYLTPGRTDYEIGLTCEPGLLWLYINGKLFRKLDVARFELDGGKVGLAAAIFENTPVTAHFDWFRVSQPAE